MTQTRQHETEISLPARPEEVWRAITDAGSVTAWYAPEARIDARAGGEYFVSWGPGLDGPGTIEVFEPNRHLRIVSELKETVSCEEPGSAAKTEPVAMAIDIYLEPAGGGTSLRLVHSGFPTSADWDNQYNGTKMGWPIMLRSLRYGLAKHPGVAGRQSWLYVTTALPQEEAWSRFAGALGDGAPEHTDAPRELCAAWTEWGDGLVYGAFATRAGVTGVSLHVVLYGDAAGRIGEAAGYWKRKLDQIYGTAAVGAP